MFKDITTALKDKDVFKAIIDNLYELVKDKKIDYVVAIESRGYILGAPLAYKLGAGLVIARKPGKLPAPVERVEYGLEYGKDVDKIKRKDFPNPTRQDAYGTSVISIQFSRGSSNWWNRKCNHTIS